MVPIPETLAKVCYKQIDGDYWYGWYIDLQIIINKSNNYVNATKLCRELGKHFYHWTCSNQVQSVITAFESAQLAPPYSVGQNEWLIQVVESGGSDTAHLISGTYIHPSLVPALAIWLSPTFYLKVCTIINDFAIDHWKKIATHCEKTLRNIINVYSDLTHLQMTLRIS